ncbi:MAG: hypothetical protein JWO05_2116 [Gemmatimonadetes bacterium]|nr:hypothetical protein [Gemmatimonadota bacterium]
MTAPNNRTAVAALDAARPVIARLDRGRHTEDLAADLIESWSAVETALRSLVGGSTLSGQALIREARGRQLLNFDQGNALAAFHAARERCDRPEYAPSEQDINTAREAFLKLESGLVHGDTIPASTMTPEPALQTSHLRQSPLGTAEVVPPMDRSGKGGWMKWAVLGLGVVAGLALVAFFVTRGGNTDSLDQGVKYYQGGQRELAVGAFTKAARDNPGDALPHVYLSRMAREAGNLTIAGEEAQAALKADPNSGVAMREMGSYLLQAGNFDLARKFYVRAVAADSGDKSSQGFLGCTMIKLGRIDEGMKWMNRAGQGSWSACAQGVTARPPSPYGAQAPPLTSGPRP